MVNVFFVPYVLGPYATVLQAHHLVDVAPVRRPGTMIKILNLTSPTLQKLRVHRGIDPERCSISSHRCRRHVSRKSHKGVRGRGRTY